MIGFSTSWVRVTLLSLLLILGLVVGYLRWTYAIIWDKGFYLLRRSDLYKVYPYPGNIEGFVQSLLSDPRWISLVVYSFFSFFLSVSSVYLTFLNPLYVRMVVKIYVVAWLLVVFLFMISIATANYSIGIGLAQNFKNLLQTPFFTLLLIAGLMAHTYQIGHK